jgi:hypothetical protein
MEMEKLKAGIKGMHDHRRAWGNLRHKLANWSRILSKDYEIKPVYEGNAFIVSHLHSLLKRY